MNEQSVQLLGRLLFDIRFIWQGRADIGRRVIGGGCGYSDRFFARFRFYGLPPGGATLFHIK